MSGQRRIEDGGELVPVSWGDGDNEMTVSAWGQREFGFGHKTGTGNGITLAANFVEARAVEAFVAGDDDDARALRELARRIRAEVKP